MKKILFILIGLLLLAGIYWFFNASIKYDHMSSGAVHAKAPDVIFHEVSISEIYLGTKIWQIVAEQALLDNKVSSFINSELVFFKDKKPSLSIKSPRAQLDMAKRSILIWEANSSFLNNPTANLISKTLFWDNRQKTLTARQDVRFKTQEYFLESEEALFVQLTGELIARGKVRVKTGQVSFSGKSGTYLIKQKKVALSDATVMINSDIYLQADNIETDTRQIIAYPEVVVSYEKGIRARADKAVYTIPQNIGVLEGNVKITRKKTVITGKKVYIDNKTIKIPGRVKIFKPDFTIIADTAEYISDRESAVLSGNCRLQQNNGSITCREMRLSGNVLALSGMVSLKKEDITAAADSAEYYPDIQKIILNGNSIVQKGPDQVSSEQIIVWLKTKKVLTTKGSPNETTDSQPADKEKRTKVKISSEILFK
ncbi:MAG: LptA/OstA family protein [Candidatus Margulisiibacteriota bacterium]